MHVIGTILNAYMPSGAECEEKLEDLMAEIKRNYLALGQKKPADNRKPPSRKSTSEGRFFTCLWLDCGQIGWDKTQFIEKNTKKLEKPLFSFENSGYFGGRYRT